MIDVDDEALAQAARQLGTKTKVDTVNEALRLAAGIESRTASARRLLLALGESDIDNREVMAGAWRRP
ncbi:MAG: type II toxin-antitoxin system VapB family antitoxin [Sporichthyaceae bacterium]